MATTTSNLVSAKLPRGIDAVTPFIDGGRVSAADPKTVRTFNPSSGEALLQIPTGSVIDVQRAVESARKVFRDGRWSQLPPSKKEATLARFAALIKKEAATLDALDALEMGKPVGLKAFNAEGAAGHVEFFAGAINKVLGAVLPSDSRSFVTQIHVPRGVIAAIVPWNFPTFNAILKIAPALAAGNSVVLKPSELSSLSALRLAELAVEAGVPEGVLNVVPGLGETVGRALGLHSDVDMVAFTGSTAVGKLMLQYSGSSNMKVVLAECGGKSPQIVFNDGVDTDSVAASIAQSILTNQGQVCSTGSRVLVHQSIEEEILTKVLANMRTIKVGDALDDATTFGPLVTRQQLEKVHSYVEAGKSSGAKLAYGASDAGRSGSGYFVTPTVFANVPPQARIAQEEIFGPVLSFISFSSEEEAIRIANDTMYGLAAFVWTRNLATGLRFAKSVQAGLVCVNACAITGEGAGHGISIEPYGQSGVGTESGLAGMESYLRRQLVWFNH